ncbi:MAG: hypothetical protein VYC39_16410 [Myxococcota bacterium]|nr:hypothetical protein [Myxococcota bacterium]
MKITNAAIFGLVLTLGVACTAPPPAAEGTRDTARQGQDLDAGTTNDTGGATRLDTGFLPDADPNPATDAGENSNDAMIPGDGGGSSMNTRDAGNAPDAARIPDVGFIGDSGVPPTMLTVTPDFVSIPFGDSISLNLGIPMAVPTIWSVDGVPGGDSAIGTLQISPTDSRSVVFSAPQDAPSIPVTRVITAQTFGGQATALITLIAPLPTVVSAMPNELDRGAPDTIVTIEGTGFVSSTVVELDGVRLPIQARTWDRLEVLVSSSLLALAGEKRLVVRSPAPGGGIVSTPFTVILKQTVIENGLPSNVASYFNNASVTTIASQPPALSYPEDNSYAPRDFPSPQFSWSQDGQQNVCRLSLRSTAAQIDIYVSGTNLATNENPNYILDSQLWSTIVSTSLQEFSIRYAIACGELNAGGLVNNTINQSAERSYTIVQDEAGGRIVYFSGLVEGLWNLEIGGNQASATPWIGPENTFALNSTNCVGCHSFSRDGQRMSYAKRAPDWSLELVDITNSVPSIRVAGSQGGEAVWTTIHPDGTYVLATDLGAQMTLLDGQTGQLISMVPTAPAGMNATQAFWSPTGDAFAFVTGTEGTNGVTDFAAGEIWTMSFSVTGGQPQFGTPVRIAGPDVIGGTAYYPAYSPDGEYLVFCRAPNGSSYNNPDASLWIAKADGTGAPVELTSANQIAGVSNSWPRWAPTTSNGRYWLLFSSQRVYPPYSGTGPQQLWVSLVDPSLLPMDPSSSAIWLSGQEPFTGNLTAEWTVAR